MCIVFFKVATAHKNPRVLACMYTLNCYLASVSGTFSLDCAVNWTSGMFIWLLST